MDMSCSSPEPTGAVSANTAAPTQTVCRPLNSFEVPFWAYDQLGGAIANVVPIRLDYAGWLDPDRVRATLAALARRHPALRMYVPDATRPTAALAENAPVSVNVYSLCDLPPAGAEQALNAAICLQRRTPISLGDPPLLRASIFHLTATSSVLLVTAHHIVIDGWSMANFVEQFTVAFADPNAVAKPQGSPESWASVTDLGDEDGRRFWQVTLPTGGIVAAFDDGGEPNLPEVSAAMNLDCVTAARVREAARKTGVTLFTWLATSLATLLARHCGENSVTIGVPISWRRDVSSYDALGCMVSSVPVTIIVDGTCSVAALAQTHRQSVARAIAHAGTPYQVIRKLAGRDPFAVMLNLLSFPRPTAVPAPWSLVSCPPLRSRFATTLYVDWQRDGATIELVADPRRVSAAYAVEIVQQFAHLLKSSFTDATEPIETLRLQSGLDNVRRARLTKALEYDADGSPTYDILHHIADAPDAIAVDDGLRQWTYGELGNASASIATALEFYRDAGEGAQRTINAQVIAISGPRSFCMVAAVVGALRAGMPFMLTDAASPGEQLRQAQSIFASVVDLVVLPTGSDVVSVRIGARVFNVELIRAHYYAPDNPPHGRAAAYVTFTSGTTGPSKPIIGNHAGLAHFVRWQRDRFGINATNRFAFITNLAFDVVLRDLLTPLIAGAAVCVPPLSAFGRGAMLRWMAHSRITDVHLVPSLARRWLADDRYEKLPALRHAFFAGELLDNTLISAWHKRAGTGTIVNLYGPSETTLAKCYNVVAATVRHDCIPVGRPLPATQVFIERSGRAAAVGEIGDILLRTRYHTNAQLAIMSATSGFVANPFGEPGDWLYRTGDIGRILPDGTLQVVGRRDAQIKIRGRRVDLDELASRLRHLSGVRDAVVLHDPQRDTLRAFVASDRSQTELWAALRHVLSGRTLPGTLNVIAAMPLTANGKIDRRALASLPDTVQAPYQRQQRTMPDDPVAKALAEIWESALSRSATDFDDDFFRLGGDSLEFINLHADICAHFGCEIDLAAAFRHPTLRQFHTELTQQRPVLPVRAQPISLHRDVAARRLQARSNMRGGAR